MTEVNHEHEAEKAEYKRHVGDFDAYVQDGQEKAARKRYERFRASQIDSDDFPISFEEWSAVFDQPSRDSDDAR